MNSSVLYNSIRFILLLTLQVVIFNKIDFWGYVNPYPYVLFIILYPVNGNKYGLLLASFLLGILMDMFSNSGGVHTAACLLVAYVRPSIFRFSFGLSYEYQTIRLNDVLTPERFSFILIVIVLHHLTLFTLEGFSFDMILEILLRTVFSTLFTLIICILIIYLIKPSRR